MRTPLLLATVQAFPVHAQQARLEGAPALEHVAVIQTAAPRAEIVSVESSTRRAVLTHSATGAIELFDLADPARPRSVKVIELGLASGEGLTSVALPPQGDWFLAVVKARDELAPGQALIHSLVDGARLAAFPTGVGPDCVCIDGEGRRALIANEAEEFDDQGSALVSAPGSLTVIELASELARSRVTQISFENPLEVPVDGRLLVREVDDKEEEIPLQVTPAFIEPEVAVFLPDGKRALVTLQENNAIAYLDLAAGRIERIVGLGTTTHAADLHDDGRFDERGQITARLEPDGLAVLPGGRYFVTADEGDTAPNVEKTVPGRPNGGGRTLSVFDLETGRKVGDTGAQLDRMAALADLYPDKRSPKKGGEPEMVVAFERGGVPLAAVTLERAGALALVDLRDPTKPAVIAVGRTGNDHLKDEPEGLAHFRDPSSGADYLYVANEGTGTLGVLRVPR